jgi:hypothetical protein
MSAIPPLTLEQITQRGIDPALRELPCKLDSLPARVQLLAIGQQESGGFLHRRQTVWTIEDGRRVLRDLGPAKSFWMGEVGGGLVHNVRSHAATKEMAALLYAARHVKPTDIDIWNAIENDDVLAAGLARLLIYTEPRKLPALGDADEAWRQYVDTWRPGKPRPETWPGYYEQALKFVVESAE